MIVELRIPATTGILNASFQIPVEETNFTAARFVPSFEVGKLIPSRGKYFRDSKYDLGHFGFNYTYAESRSGTKLEYLLMNLTPLS
jgi:hypothetical protein